MTGNNSSKLEFLLNLLIFEEKVRANVELKKIITEEVYFLSKKIMILLKSFLHYDELVTYLKNSKDIVKKIREEQNLDRNDMIKKIIKDIPEKTKVQIEQKNINEIKKIINGNEELKIKLKTIPKVLKKKIYKFNLIDFFEIIDSETYSKLLSLFDMEYINNILKGEIHIQEEKIFLYTNHNDIFFNAFGHIDKGNFYPEYLLNLQDSYFNTREYFKKTGWKNIKKNKDIKYKNYSFICYDYVQLQKPNKLDNKLKAILLLSLYQMKIQQILQRNNDNAIYEEVKLLNIDILNEYHYNKVYGNLENNNDYNNLIKEYLKNIELHDINLDSLDQFMGLFMNDKKLIEINNQIKKKTKKNPIPKNQIITLIDKKIKFYENFIFVGKEFYKKYIKNNLSLMN